MPWKEDREQSQGPERKRREFSFAPWAELPPVEQPAHLNDDQARLRVEPWERCAAMLGILCLAPVMGAVALAIKLDSPGGSIIYSQERVGVNRRRDQSAPDSRTDAEKRNTGGYGKKFHVHKFRTMIPDAEKLTGPVWAAEKDPRITRVGRVLRKLRLDEIPQLFNVLWGEMRLIGPRPERPHFVHQLTEHIPEYPLRQKIPPGITGLAQVEREYDASVDDVRKKVKYDLYYVRHCGRLMNLKIFLKTIEVMIRGRGAR